MTVDFIKTHALGNDFLLTERGSTPEGGLSALAQKICNRNFGVGADGLIYWKLSGDVFDLRIFNCDGSEPECSGNGLRCTAAYLIESGTWPKPQIQLRTVSGVYTLARIGEEYEADMGVPGLRPEVIPFIASSPVDRVVDYPLDVDGETVRISACSTGNPHCSLFMTDLDEKTIRRLGPKLERHSAFPNRTNVEFIRVINSSELQVVFWERGVGPTYASGTGSCGATVASILNGRTGRAVTVHTKAGKLRVEWPENGRLKLTSTARVVAEREISGSLMDEILDLIIIGAGPTGLATAIDAHRRGMKYVVLEKGCITNSIYHFPSQMVFFTTPELLEIGGIPLVSEREKPTRNEALKYYRKIVGAMKLNVHQYEEAQNMESIAPHRFRVTTSAGSYSAANVVIAIGYYDNPNILGIPGEDLPHVSHYYTEPYAFYDRDVVVVGGKNSAAEAALDLFRGGARVSLVHRGSEMGSTLKYWVRPDIENRFKAGEVKPFLNSRVVKITNTTVELDQLGKAHRIPAQQVFLLTGYHTSTEFFRQVGVQFDRESLRPTHNPETFETNVPGVYLAGSVVGGRMNAEVFIENGRLHGEAIIKAIANRGI